MQKQVSGATTSTDTRFLPLELPAMSIDAFSSRMHRLTFGHRFRETRRELVSTFPKARAT
jgi:hypothetical protein